MHPETTADYMEVLMTVCFLNHAREELRPGCWVLVHDQLTDDFMTLTFWWALDCTTWNNWKELFDLPNQPEDQPKPAISEKCRGLLG